MASKSKRFLLFFREDRGSRFPRNAGDDLADYKHYIAEDSNIQKRSLLFMTVTVSLSKKGDN
jgi:hypothetical protein